VFVGQLPVRIVPINVVAASRVGRCDEAVLMSAARWAGKGIHP